MKQKLLYLIFSITAILIIMHSCKKDRIIDQQNNESVYSVEAMTVWHKLVNFKSRMESSYKNNEPMTSDSALWYLEALYNVQYGYPDTAFRRFSVDTSYYQIPYNANQLHDFTDVTTAYNQMINNLTYQLDQIESEFKYLYIADLSIIDSSGSNLSLQLISKIGVNIWVLYQPFCDTDNYLYGNMKGKCDYTYKGKFDAGEILEGRLNSPNFVPSGMGKFYSVITADAWYWEYPTNTNPYGNYEIFQELGDTTPPCLEYYKLQYYLPRAHDILYNTIGNGGERPETLVFGSVDIKSKDSLEFVGFDTIHHYSHYYVIDYGERQYMPPIPD